MGVHSGYNSFLLKQKENSGSVTATFRDIDHSSHRRNAITEEKILEVIGRCGFLHGSGAPGFLRLHQGGARESRGGEGTMMVTRTKDGVPGWNGDPATWLVRVGPRSRQSWWGQPRRRSWERRVVGLVKPWGQKHS